MNYWTRAQRRRVGRRQVLIGAAGIAAFLAACGGSDDSSNGGASGVSQATPGSGFNTTNSGGAEPKRDGTLTIGVNGDPRSMDPHTGTGGNDHHRIYMSFDNLVGYDAKGQLDPSVSLAESWEQFDDRVVLKIRSGIKFHDDTPFAAEDVKWNLERQLDPATRATDRPNLLVIDRVEVTSPTEVVLRLKEPSAPLLTNFGERAGMMVSKTAVERLKDDFARRPSGTGPFILREWVSDAFMLYERNPNYWRKDAQGRAFPYMKTVRIETMPDDAVRVAALEAGDIDLLGISTPAADVKRLNDMSTLQWARFVGFSTTMFYISHVLPPMDNVNFRKALASALDVPSYIKNFLSGEEPAAGGLIPPASWAHDANIKPIGYDANRARQFLQASGVSGANAKVRGAVVPLPITETHQLWTQNLKDAGITMEWIAEQNASTRYVYKNFGGDGTAHLSFSGYTLKVDPDAAITAFYTAAGSYNAGAQMSPQIEELVLKARRETQQAERQKIYSEIQRQAFDQVLSTIPLNYTVKYVHANKNVGNMENIFGGEGKERYANLWI